MWNRVTSELLRDMGRIQQEVNRTLRDQSYDGEFPPVNVYANSDRAVLVSEVPGMEPASLDVTVSGETITIAGVVSALQAAEGENIHRAERFAGKYSRTIRLPYPVNPEQVVAMLKNGVLRIELPRVEHDKPRKIEIKSA